VDNENSNNDAVSSPMGEQAIRNWLLDYVWLDSHQANKQGMVDCIMSQNHWQHLSARADQFASAQWEPGPKAFAEGIGFALSEMYECHSGPHLESCPDYRPAKEEGPDKEGQEKEGHL
jgi:hypothetical protein